MNDNLIAQAAIFVWRILSDLWEIYSSTPSFVLSLFDLPSSALFIVSAWICLIGGTLWLIYVGIEYKLTRQEAISSQRFMEVKKATLSALAESANSDEVDVTLPSKATIDKGSARTEALLEQILETLNDTRRELRR